MMSKTFGSNFESSSHDSVVGSSCAKKSLFWPIPSSTSSSSPSRPSLPLLLFRTKARWERCLFLFTTTGSGKKARRQTKQLQVTTRSPASSPTCFQLFFCWRLGMGPSRARTRRPADSQGFLPTRTDPQLAPQPAREKIKKINRFYEIFFQNLAKKYEI